MELQFDSLKEMISFLEDIGYIVTKKECNCKNEEMLEKLKEKDNDWGGIPTPYIPYNPYSPFTPYYPSNPIVTMENPPDLANSPKITYETSLK